jgi:hypothetical protein
MTWRVIAGAVFDTKVRVCSRLVHKYVERAASALPDLVNVTTFFNTDTELSTVQALACKDGSVCVEDTPLYSLFGKLAFGCMICTRWFEV